MVFSLLTGHKTSEVWCLVCCGRGSIKPPRSELPEQRELLRDGLFTADESKDLGGLVCQAPGRQLAQSNPVKNT